MTSAVDVHRRAHAAFNDRDWETMGELVAPDVVYRDHPRGIELHGLDEFLGWLREWTTGMSDARVDDARYLDAGTHAVAQFRGRGTNDGTLGPANATGRSMDLDFCEILEIRDGRMASGDIYYDALTMMSQLGVVEAPAPA